MMMSVVLVATSNIMKGADQDAAKKIRHVLVDCEKNLGWYLYRRYIVGINGAIMKTSCAPRLLRRYRRSVPLPATRSQIRQKIDRLRDLYELEAVLELSRAKPDINYLLQLDLESSFLRDVVASIGEQI
jgi:hypothetical protein